MFRRRTAQLFFGADADTAYDFLLGLAGRMLEGVDDDAKARARRELRRPSRSISAITA
jgi:hypothetical protein